MVPAEDGALLEVALHGAEGGRFVGVDAVSDLDGLERHCGFVFTMLRKVRLLRRCWFGREVECWRK